MKSSEEKSGLSDKENKIVMLCQELSTYYDDHKLSNTDEDLTNGDLTVKIKRYDLRQIVIDKLEVFNAETVNTWIMFLIRRGYLIQNPDSHIIKTKNKKEIIKPHNDTMYFIDPRKLEESLETLRIKLDNFRKKKSVYIHTKTLLEY
jgi:hypothetical protein